MDYEDCERANAAEMTLDETREVMGEKLANEQQKVETLRRVTDLLAEHRLVDAIYARLPEVDSVVEDGFVDIKPGKRITVTLVLEEEG